MNLLGTPKISSALTLENMQMEFVFEILFFCFFFFKKKKFIKLNYNQATRKHQSKAACDNFEYFHFQIEGTTEIYLSHIFNINSLRPYRQEKTVDAKNKSIFREILSDSNLEKVKKENKSFQVYKAKLNKGDLLFIPSFYFRQVKSSGEVNANLNYKFKTHSRILNSVMMSLFDEKITEA